MDKLVTTPTMAAKLLATSLANIFMMLESGELPAYRQGRNWKIPVELLKEYVIERAYNEARERKENYQIDNN